MRCASTHSSSSRAPNAATRCIDEMKTSPRSLPSQRAPVAGAAFPDLKEEPT
jgi:hypothetical protein